MQNTDTSKALSNFINGTACDADGVVLSTAGGGGSGKGAFGGGQNGGNAGGDMEKHIKQYHHGVAPKPGHCKFLDEKREEANEGSSGSGGDGSSPFRAISPDAVKSYMDSVRNGSKPSFKDIEKVDDLWSAEKPQKGGPGDHVFHDFVHGGSSFSKPERKIDGSGSGMFPWDSKRTDWDRAIPVRKYDESDEDPRANLIDGHTVYEELHGKKKYEIPASLYEEVGVGGKRIDPNADDMKWDRTQYYGDDHNDEHGWRYDEDNERWLYSEALEHQDKADADAKHKKNSAAVARRQKWLKEAKPGTRISSRKNTYVKGEDGKWYVEDYVWDDDGEHLNKKFLRPYKGYPLCWMKFVDSYCDPENDIYQAVESLTKRMGDVPYKPLHEAQAKAETKPTDGNDNDSSLADAVSDPWKKVGWIKAVDKKGNTNRGIPHKGAVDAVQSLFPDLKEFSFEDVTDDETGKSSGQNMFVRSENGSEFTEEDANDMLEQIRKTYPEAQILGDGEGEQIQIFLPNTRLALRSDGKYVSVDDKTKKNGAVMDEENAIGEYMETVRGAVSGGDENIKKTVLEENEPVDEAAFTGENPLLKDDERAMGLNDAKDKDALESYLEEFNLYSPLTEFEKEILERGVNDEVFDALREKAKDAEVAGDIEEMELLRKLIATYERVKDKGLRSHYIEIDKDTGEIVRGNYGENAGALEKGVPEPPPKKTEEGEGEGGEEGEGEANGEENAEEPPPLEGEGTAEGEGAGEGEAKSQSPSQGSPAPSASTPPPSAAPQQNATASDPTSAPAANAEGADANTKASLQTYLGR